MYVLSYYLTLNLSIIRPSIPAFTRCISFVPDTLRLK